jgi:hypothetical protein
MSAVRPDNENRQSCRIPVGDDVYGELILANRSKWPVQILDQSAGGFGVLCDRLPPIACGDIVKLRTESLLSEVRVVHWSNSERDADPAGGEQSPSTPQYRLGLIRLRDISVPKEVPVRRGRRVGWHISTPGFAHSPLALFAVVFGAVVVVSVAVSVLNSGGSAQRPGAENQSDPSGSFAQSGRNASRELRVYEAKRLPGALPFVMSGMARELNLSDAQVAQIRQIVDDTNEAMARNEQARRILENSRKRAVGVLTAQQRLLWESLTSAHSLATGPDETALSTSR